MPFIRTSTNLSISDTAAVQLKKALGEAITQIPGKSENWLMLELQGDKKMYFAGSDAPLLLAEVSLFGTADAESYAALTKTLTRVYADALSVPADRIYIKYAETDHWGWNGRNF